MVHQEARRRLSAIEARLQSNLHRPKLEELIADLGRLMEDPSSARLHKTRYSRTLILLWYTKAKALFGQAISESVAGKLQNDNGRLNLADKMDHLENWTWRLAKAQMDFDAKLNALAKSLLHSAHIYRLHPNPLRA